MEVEMNISYVKAIKEFDRIFRPVLIVETKKNVETIAIVKRKEDGSRLVKRS
jgi:hypothetical protein